VGCAVFERPHAVVEDFGIRRPEPRSEKVDVNEVARAMFVWVGDGMELLCDLLGSRHARNILWLQQPEVRKVEGSDRVLSGD
jgi:hypothetical protein